MSSQHIRKRSRSRDSSRHSSHAKRHKSSRSSDERQEMFSTILANLKDLKSDISSCKARICDLENHSSFNGVSEPLQDQSFERDSDTLSVSAGNDFDRPDSLQQDQMATQPPNSAIQPPNLAIQPPNSAIQPPNSTNQASIPTAISAQAETLQQQPEATENIPASLYDPEASATSWAPSSEFTTFLEKNFRRRLSYDQVCDILDEQAVPAVDALLAPTLDQSMLHHVAPQNKKFLQERDKELANVQRSMLNATGPLCSLHDQLEQGGNLAPSELKIILEQTLCLLGSANTQLSTLRRKKILASINKSKIDLANQPLPNARKSLFGEDFPSIASKEAELSRGLAKNLAPSKAADKSKPHYPGPRDSRYSNLPWST
ncbi:uncharacterized protein LOC114532832 [Dendronephthya gigantea]|uniref:uncharacterized protein LOC114532832 n=1 Tax=Dendronephthya gigantea TaxID=151771 RepID=UPI00106B4B46|nr:uncharacterized protein LOC114532832 [Dendronephthya gigantea]